MSERLSEAELSDLEAYCSAPPQRAFEPIIVRALAELRDLREENKRLRPANIAERFDTLARHWKLARPKYQSDPTMHAMVDAYQRIIGLGPAVVPLILAEMQHKPDHWFWALEAITGVNPIPEQSRGDFKQMIAAWLQWGRDNGHLPKDRPHV